ncbi:MAG: long-chain fatty acid--CoA ligase [Phaeodactylibacter sp.]|nr:long-chain fatty acid--CoA ligase [Phaeodactylibacter sp.]MCB9273088.1 long-chain fatty acid--CoA ligase [Lewinellaceae bacterium]
MDFRRLFDILPYQQARFPQQSALAYKAGGRWEHYSIAACIEAVNRVSAGLLRLGLEQGDRVAIFSYGGSPRWIFSDLGAQQAGFISVPVHATASEQELAFILRETDARYCLLSGREQLERVKALMPGLPALRGYFTLDTLAGEPGWEQFVAEPSAQDTEHIGRMREAIPEDALATIIYTSGTTGEPKGVMLSHRNIVSNIKATMALLPADHTKRAVSFLPLSHIFERMVAYTYLAMGVSLFFAGPPEQLLETFREARPHYFTAVPRYLEKAYDEIVARTRRQPAPVRALMRWAIKVGEQYRSRRRFGPGYRARLFWARLLAFRVWRRHLGGKVEGVYVGAAALQPRLARLFTAAGIPIYEGYGLTETSPVIAFNRAEPGGVRFGTAGIPLPGLELKLDKQEGDEEGEILVKGPGVMMGYYKREAETKAVFTEDGWFRTGDVGRIVHKRFLQITGRKKDIFKTSSGKYVAPLEVENHMKGSAFVEECLVIGFQRSFPAALLLPNFEALEQWCREHKVHWTAPAYMVHNNKVQQLMDEVLRQANETLPSHKRIRNYHLLSEPWTVETGELTPTFKTRREAIFDKFRKEIEAIYEQGARL